MEDTLGESRYLYMEYFLATFFQGIAGRGKGMRVDYPGQVQRPVGKAE